MALATLNNMSASLNHYKTYVRQSSERQDEFVSFRQERKRTVKLAFGSVMPRHVMISRDSNQLTSPEPD